MASSFEVQVKTLLMAKRVASFAHEGLMNSKGHRDNILQDIYSHLGTGVAFNEKSTPFYTETFLLK